MTFRAALPLRQCPLWNVCRNSCGFHDLWVSHEVMLWSDTLNELAVEVQVDLTNGLSTGLGWTALAARRAARDAGVEAVRSAVAGAHDALGHSLRLLPPSLTAASDNIELMQVTRAGSSPTWQKFLDSYAEDEKERIHALVASALDQTTRAAVAIRTDASTEIVISQIIAARGALRRLHSRLTADDSYLRA